MKLLLIIALFLPLSVVAQKKWSKGEVQAYMNACVDGCKETLGDEKANKYCDCTLRKIEKKFPDASKLSHVSEKKKNKVITKVAKECLKEN